MSSKILPPQGGPRLETPLWRQAGAPVSASRQTQGVADDDQVEAAQLRARVAELEAKLSIAVEQARMDSRRDAEAEAARAEAQLRNELTGRLEASVMELLTVRSQMRRQMEEDLVRLAVVVARRVVRRELTVDPDALLGIARAAIEQIEAREIHRVRVAARDVELMKRLLGERGLPARINVAADAELEAGSLIFETARGTIDASVEVQLAEIDRGLADVLRRSA